jgi:biotin operon repressor
MLNNETVERLQQKTAQETLVERLKHDFNLSPMVARTLIKEVTYQWESFYREKQAPGQLTYLAVSRDSPAGRKLSECRRVAVKLSLHDGEDMVAGKKNLATMRQQRLLRLVEEAYDQGGLLTHEDLACLLCSSAATIKRDVKKLREQGYGVSTRGQVKDIGKGVTHKAQIVADYLAGYTFSEIERRRHHSIRAIERYCQDFVRVLKLHQRGSSIAEMRQVTGLSERLIGEHLSLYARCPADNDRLQILLGDPDEATEQPAEIKRGRWLK